jgi:MerR family Zn(II)-responsive transcriptional regulator of zntA
MMKISELSAQTGLSSHTIRFYEKHGLISASERSAAGYRYYNAADVRRAEFVKTARHIGFSLEDIGLLLSIRLDKQSHSCQEVTDITRHKLDEVNDRISELRFMQQTLKRLLDSCCGGPENTTHCSIIEALDAGDVARDAEAVAADTDSESRSRRMS